MSWSFKAFVAEEDGAITVDWVVLSSAVVAMSIAATDVLRGGLADVASDLEAQLRSQQISDAFVVFTSAHFEPLYEAGLLTEAQAADLFDLANTMTNAQILTALEAGIAAMNAGTLSDTEMAQLIAVASVAYQRNIVDDSVFEENFGLATTA